VAVVGLAQSTVSAHLHCLRECGLVAFRPQGRASMFFLTCAPELAALLSAAEQPLGTPGDDVQLCPPTAPRPLDAGGTSITGFNGEHRYSRR
jgi:hypothetical protein